MVFSSLAFLCVFLPVVFLLHFFIRNAAVRNALLIVASLLFYAYGEPVFVLLMLGSSAANWLVGLAIDKFPEHKKAALTFACVFNLGMLGLFKYASLACEGLGLLLPGAAAWDPHLPLPVGISFYTFQALSYVIDVYRGQHPAQHSFARVLLYISFFPQLIAGPIITYHDVEAQLARRTLKLENMARGFRMFVAGLAKKVLVANSMALVVDNLFAHTGELNVLSAWLLLVAYMLQIYFDFSGYSDMAIGMAQLFGFSYPKNFNYPYVSCSIQEFWRRWHISLSTWFRDYLYIPLGGNRRGKLRTVTNKMIVFLTCGLWHGASLTFVIWGFFHGLFLLLEEYLPIKKLPKFLGWIYAMFVVGMLFVLFRADDMGSALNVYKGLVSFNMSESAMAVLLEQLSTSFVLCLLVGLVAQFPVIPAFQKFIAQREGLARAVEVTSYAISLGLLVLCILVLSSGVYNPFIYFRF